MPSSKKAIRQDDDQPGRVPPINSAEPNAILGVSLAKQKRQPIHWPYYCTVISAGLRARIACSMMKHSQRRKPKQMAIRPDAQEFMVMPLGASTFAEGLRRLGRSQSHECLLRFLKKQRSL